jgi:hypothetical protein
MIAGNWKSNKTYSEALDFVKNTINPLKFNPNNVGTPPLTQTSSSLPSPSTSQASSPSTPETHFTTALPLRTARTTATAPTLARSVPST